MPNDEHCASFEDRELRILSYATALEILIAMQEYSIDMKGVWGFSKLLGDHFDDGIFRNGTVDFGDLGQSVILSLMICC